MSGSVCKVAFAGLVLLSGCAGPEPFDRPNTWRATGVNDSNLAAMVVRPADLARGRGTGLPDGQVTATAVDRLRSGQVKPLTNGSSSAGGAAAAVGLTGS